MALGRRNPSDMGEPLLHGDAGAQYLGLPQRRQPPASRGFAGDVARVCGPTLPIWETPITSVTNGVHVPSWINGDLADLYDQYLEPDWRERTGTTSRVEAGAMTSRTKSCSKCIAAANAA